MKSHQTSKPKKLNQRETDTKSKIIHKFIFISRWRKAQYLGEDELLVVQKGEESISLSKGLELQINRPRNRNIQIVTLWINQHQTDKYWQD